LTPLSSRRSALGRHENANQTYLDQGLALVEVANRAAEMYVGRTPDQKRRMLNFVLLNSTWRDGKLEAEWREPFNLLAKSIAEYKNENAPSVVTGGVRSQWLPVLEQVRTFCWNPDPDEVLQMDLRKYHFPNGMPRPRKVWEAPVRT
jgi:hypothetical protein